MCILVKKGQGRLRTSKKPIKAYKIICHKPTSGRVWCGGSAYETPYMECALSDNIVEGKDIFEDNAPFWLTKVEESAMDGTKDSWFRKYGYIAGKGLIHCFLNKEDALRTTLMKYRDMVLMEVEIPAGTEYIKGDYGYRMGNERDPHNKMPLIGARGIRFTGRLAIGVSNDYWK